MSSSTSPPALSQPLAPLDNNESDHSCSHAQPLPASPPPPPASSSSRSSHPMIFKDTTTTSTPTMIEKEEEEQQEEEGEEIIYTYPTKDGGSSDDHLEDNNNNNNNKDDSDHSDYYYYNYGHSRDETNHQKTKSPHRQHDPTFAYYPPRPQPRPSQLTSTSMSRSSGTSNSRSRSRYADRRDDKNDGDHRDHNDDKKNEEEEGCGNDTTCTDDNNDDDLLSYYHDRFELVIVAAATSLEEDDHDSNTFNDDAGGGDAYRHHHHYRHFENNDEAAEQLLESTTTTTTTKKQKTKTKTVVVIDPPPTGTRIQHVQNEQEQLPPPTSTVGEPTERTNAMPSSTIDPAGKDLHEDQGDEEHDQNQLHGEDHHDSISRNVINDIRTKEDPDGMVFNDIHEKEQAADQDEADNGGRRHRHEKVCDDGNNDGGRHFVGMKKDESNSDNHHDIYCHLSSEDFCNYFDGNDDSDDHHNDDDKEQKRLDDDPDGATTCAAVVVAAVATAVGTNAAASDKTKFVKNSHGYHNDDDDGVQAHDEGENLKEIDCEGNSGDHDYHDDGNVNMEEGDNEGQNFNDFNDIKKPERKEGKDRFTGPRKNIGTRNSHHSHNDDDDDEDTNGSEQQLSPEEGGRQNPRSTWTMAFSTIVLCLELAVAMIALIFHDDIMECCDQSIFSRNEETADRWNKAMFGIAIGYVCLVVVEIPIVVLLEEPFFLFNPMIGFLLTIHMMYVTNTGQAYVMFGLESVAMLGQSIILIHMERNAEVCLHAIFNYTICGLVVYILIELTREGGYCIVDGELKTVFQESTCNMLCTDDEACFVCDIDSLNGQVTDATNSSCFIHFPSTGWF